MNFNWKIIRKKLYGILKSPGREIKNVSMYDEKGNETIDPSKANRFFVEIKSVDPNLDTYKILTAIRDEGQSSHIDVKTPNLFNEKDFDTVENLVQHIRSAIGVREGIKVNWQQFDKEIDTREESMYNISESKDVGKLSGTTKSSFQRIGNAKLIVRHTDTVNEEKHGARTRHIKSLFVESKNGERFAYPHLHMTGARAFARHISHGGSNHDDIAKTIYQLSEDYLSLKATVRAVRMFESAQQYFRPIRTSMEGINKKLKSMHGPKGYANVTKEMVNENILVDLAAIEKLHTQLAETCQCQQETPLYKDLGVAAKYMAQNPSTIPVTFTWSRQPDMSAYTSDSISQRMHDQIMELASACTNEDAAMRLREVANLIMNGQSPEQSQLDMVKEAFASSLKYVPEKTVMPEEVEFDSFISEFELNNIFQETDAGSLDEDAEQDSVDALVAAGENPDDAEQEVMDNKPKNESIDDDFDDNDDSDTLGHVHQYGDIIAKAGDKVLTVDDDEEYDADGELENVKRRYTVLTDLGNDKYERVTPDPLPDITPYDRNNKEALDAFKKLYDTEEDKVDEGFWDNVKQAGREFWHGTPEEKETERRTQMAFDKDKLKKDIASGKVRVTDKDGNPIEIKEDRNYLYKKLRLNPDGSVDVVGFYTAPEHSVLAGQTLKRFINTYNSEEEAKQAHPDAEGYSSKYTDPQVSLRQLPGEEDPVPGGMYPDDIKEDLVRLSKLAGI